MPEITLQQRLSSLGFTDAVSHIISNPEEKTAQEPPKAKSTKPTDLLRILTSAFGAGWVTWEPETIWSEMRRVFGEAPNEITKGKVQALKTLLVTNAFWVDHLAFEKVVLAVNGRIPIFDQYQHPSPAMIAFAMEEAATIRGARFSDEVLRYIAAVCFESGLIILPEPLDAAQESLDEMTEPIVGRQLREDLKRQWSSLNGEAQGVYTETVAGIQMARMKAIREYVESSVNKE
jgi:hypothetical protein